MRTGKRLLLVTILILVGAFLIYAVGDTLSLAGLKKKQLILNHWVTTRPVLSGGVFFLLYVLITALSLPGAALITLLSGVLFGPMTGTLLASFASTSGAVLAMLMSRFLLREWVQQRFALRLSTINAGIRQEGAFYLFALRLVPIFPFFLINLAMGLTYLPVSTFWWVSQLGMLPGTLVYVNAGRELGQLTSLAGILSPGMMGAFVLLGLLPLISRQVVNRFRARQREQQWQKQKPRRFDRNIIVIGAGSGGLVSAYIAAAVKAKVTLIEKGPMGGDCLNTGCVPSKALIRTARLAYDLTRASTLGFRHVTGDVDFAAVMERVQQVVQRIAPHDSEQRYTQLGVEVISGAATVTSPWHVMVNGRQLSARALIIATGARPVIPAIPGIEKITPLTTENIWQLREKPQRLLILGGGPIGCELAQAFQRLGCSVTMVISGERLLRREDRQAADMVMNSLQADGVDIRLSYQAQRFCCEADRQWLECRNKVDGTDVALPFDRVLLALGRQARVTGFGLESLQLKVRDDGTLETDDFLATRFPHIFAVGDVTGPYQFTHAAAHQAWYAVVNALFGSLKRFRVDYRLMPRTTFTDPEVAHVGLNEQDLMQAGMAYETTLFDLAELDRAITEETAYGYIQILTEPGRDRILGATIVGKQAGELITEYVTAMKHGYGLNEILGTIHVYPTLSEANKYVAGEWKRNHTPQRILGILARYHQWRLRR
ncbi:FAD-dependent oxidoreductase (plasmid) [Edwardsiella tarda]|uniref:FAD-dependent oxidoreductase n=1 Tax=Edwardsiella tarda TaxID=636 RepID=UPI0024445214|nr:bifunctional TVP38/TMEM64 family protein/FAD-dependent oxidoreductase [Edwardsiella tarda]WGE30915.1 FAD-dependent oxidoreductase [Edwardsiella tarda]